MEENTNKYQEDLDLLLYLTEAKEDFEQQKECYCNLSEALEKAAILDDLVKCCTFYFTYGTDYNTWLKVNNFITAMKENLKK